MPRTRPLETYPNREYWALCNRVLTDTRPFTVPCTRTQAASLRGELYAWRRACEGDPVGATLYQIDPGRLRELAWRITEAGLETVLSSTLPGPSLIRAALGELPPGVSPASVALANLLALGVDPERGDGRE